METKIKKTITEWLPDVVKNVETEKMTEYEILHTVSDYCIKLINTSDGKEKTAHVFKIINMLYQEEHAYTKHCIENEFICNFIENSPALRLKEYLYDMPSPLKEAFIKTLIEI